MKTAKKALLLVLCAIALVVASVMGTFAYLKSTTQVVTNTFTAGKVAITLDEAKVDAYGVKDGDLRTTTGNSYKLIAGHTYAKDPTVTVAANSESSFVRMVVTITDIADLKAACDVTGQFMPGEFVTGWDPAVWACVDGYANGDGSATYVFQYNGAVDTLNGNDKVLAPLFTGFEMPETATNDEILNLEGMNITVQAYAAQADGFQNASAAMVASFPEVFVR